MWTKKYIWFEGGGELGGCVLNEKIAEDVCKRLSAMDVAHILDPSGVGTG